MDYKSRIQGVRIGGRDENGHQRTACGLEQVAETAVEAPTRAWADWDQIAVVAGLSRRERAAWCHCWRNGATSGVMLGETPHSLAAINREITKKLRKNRDVLRPYLGFLPEAEKNCQFYWSTAQSRASLGALSRSLRVTIAELNEKKTTEAAKLVRIGERVHTARVALEDAEGAANKIEVALRAEQERAVLDELPWPTPAADKQLSAARAKVLSTEAGLSATMAAMATQERIVEGLEGEICARRLEGFELALEPVKQRAFAAMREFCESAVELNVLANAHGIHSHQLAASLYPIGRDPLDGLAERMGRCDLLTHAIRFQNELWYRYRKAV